jgi:hypothetical protein
MSLLVVVLVDIVLVGAVLERIVELGRSLVLGTVK